MGAPPGVKSQADIDRLASEYADRAVRAMESGVQPGWFYERGSRAIAEVATDPQWAARFADVNAITSSEAPVRSNVGWAIQGLEQHAAGLPIQTGKYPTEASGSIRKILEGQDPHLGEKRHLYGAGLKGQGGLAPNDRWEIRSMGYNADSAGPAQHAFMHRVREVAIRKLREKTGKDLTPHEIQELNWATTRADQIGITIQKSATDTIQDAIPYYTFQHSWESVPGSTSKHLEQLARLGPGAWSEYHERVKSVILTPEGKDRLIEAMGGRLQRPAFDVPGVYKGQVSPGTQSRSLVYRTSEGGLSPASMARVEATEAARALILGQDAYAGHIPGKSPSVTQADTAVLKIGRTITSEEAGRLQGKLDEIYGPGSTAIVPTLEGTNVLNLGAEDFGKVFNARGKEIEAAIGSKAEYALAKRAGIYEELQWSSEPRSQATQFWAGRGQLTNVPRGATAMMLEKLNAAPGVRQAADSAPMRQLAGEVADMYLTLKKTALVPNDGIIRVLTAWKDGGLPAVEALVQKGLAPAIVLSILGGMWAEGSEQGE